MRDVTVGWQNNAMVGDETLELWLRADVSPAPYTLVDTVALAGASQSRLFTGLTDDTEHTLRIRAVRDGTYRAGYDGADPDAWPNESRLIFTAGGSGGGTPAAPTISGTSWSRVDASNQEIEVDVVPDDDALDLELLRNGAVVDTVAAPHVGTVTMTDANPPQAGVPHSYRARHVDGATQGSLSAASLQWPGPEPAPSALVVASSVACSYTAGWTHNISGASTEVEDNYTGSFAVQGTAGADVATLYVEKGTAITCAPPGELQFVTIRARHRVTAFAVNDYSPYVTLTETLELCDECA